MPSPSPSGRSLVAFLREGTRQDTLLVLDFDGTLYRGLFPPYCRGISNADLALVLGGLHLIPPRRGWVLLRGLLRLVALERQLYRDYRRGQLPLAQYDRTLIAALVSLILRQCEPGRIRMAARFISRFCYPQAWYCVRLLSAISEPVIVSKALAVVLEAVQQRYAGLVGGELRYFGITVDWGPPAALRPGASILSAEDKHACVRRLLHDHPGYSKAVIIGDTEDDRALRDGAAELLGRQNTFLVAVNPKDDLIRCESDLQCASWRCFRHSLAHLP